MYKYMCNMENNKRTLMCTVAVDMDNGSRDYIAKCKEMVEGYIEHTDFDVAVATNQYERVMSMFNTDRVWVMDIAEDMLTVCDRLNGFDELLKLYNINEAYIHNINTRNRSTYNKQQDMQHIR